MATTATAGEVERRELGDPHRYHRPPHRHRGELGDHRGPQLDGDQRVEIERRGDHRA